IISIPTKVNEFYSFNGVFNKSAPEKLTGYFQKGDNFFQQRFFGCCNLLTFPTCNLFIVVRYTRIVNEEFDI
ncbi:hypothetical protein T09_3139, partial [Trichinella sp. T9]